MSKPSYATSVAPSDVTAKALNALPEPPLSCAEKFQVPATGSSEQISELPSDVSTGSKITRLRLFVRMTFSTVVRQLGVWGSAPFDGLPAARKLIALVDGFQTANGPLPS